MRRYCLGANPRLRPNYTHICRHRLAVVRTHRAQLHAWPKSAELLPWARHPPWTGQGERAVRNPPGGLHQTTWYGVV